MNLGKDFKEGLKTTGKGFGMVFGGSAKLAGTVGKAAFKGVKVLAKGAIDLMLSSNENTILNYHYNGSCSEIRYILSRSLVDLTMRRPWDSYLWLILSKCENIDLTCKSGQILADTKFRSLCRRLFVDEKKDDEDFQKLLTENNYKDEEIKNAIALYNRIFLRSDDCLRNYVREIFVVSVGENITEPIYDENGEYIREASGGYAEKIVGRDDSVAVFKVTFESGHSIKLKVKYDWGWSMFTPHSYC